jgi:hypothetical protein
MKAFESIGVAVLAGLVLAIAACQTGSSEKLETYPLSDGDYFEYQILNNPAEQQFGVKTTLIYRFSDAGDGKIKVTPSSRFIGPQGENEHEAGAGSYIVSEKGQILSMGDGKDAGKSKGKFIKFWLPVSKRKTGEKVTLVNFFREYGEVADTRHWMDWDVWIVKWFRWEYYYEKDSGFLVGYTDQTKTWKLTDSSKGV